MTRYINRRRSHEPCLNDPEDVMITKKLELFPLGRLTARNTPLETSPQATISPSSTFKSIIRRVKQATRPKLELPLCVEFQNFCSVMREYYLMEVGLEKSETLTYKAYIGPGTTVDSSRSY